MNVDVTCSDSDRTRVLPGGMLAGAVVLDAGAGAVRYLDLLGIEVERTTTEGLIGRVTTGAGGRREASNALVLSGEQAATLVEAARRQGVPAERVTSPFPAVVVHSVGPQPAHLRAIEGLLGGTELALEEFTTGSGRYLVRGDRSECGPLSSLAFGPIDRAVDRGLTVVAGDGTVDKLIEINGAGLLTRVRRASQDLLIASAGEILDLGQTTRQKIDFRTCFSRVVPLLLALRCVFRESGWVPQGYWANIIIDDPSLWSRYGHLDLRELIETVDRLECACTIGMIPWNYRRSKQRIADAFASRTPRLGICYHGCNHTGAEFGERDERRLMSFFATAQQRMAAHQRITGLPCQPVMVFPQGVFSAEAMRCLRVSGCLAVANTEIQDHQHQVQVTREDLMRPALLCYHNFPLFSRRTVEEGIVNFSVDAFLGKPCLIVLHHQFFKQGFAAFGELAQNISSIHPQLSWTNLENIVMECSLAKRDAQRRRRVKFFANRAALSVNDDAALRTTTIVKRMAPDESIESVDINGSRSEHSFHDGYLEIPLATGRGKLARVSIHTNEPPAGPLIEPRLSERLRIAARRYACDFRDNYLV